MQWMDGWLPVAVASAVALLIFPVPLPMLDGLLAAQLGLSVMILLAALSARRPLALSQFPALLLLTTLLRLALNVSTTRQILSQRDAGAVVDAFGRTVIGQSLIVGVVVFIVLTLAQYLVIAKGAERVAQVAARFALDGLPGRQLAIDADVRAGLLDPETARARRAALARESGLFGAMDGVMKFVRGDAIAGLCIVAINLIGGLAIGVGQLGMSPGDALNAYARLTIGDGLVTQIPAVLTATAAAWLVTRVATPQDRSTGQAMAREMLGDGVAPLIAAALLMVLAVLPGLPTVPLAGVALALGIAGLVTMRRRPAQAPARHRVEAGPPVTPFGLVLHPDALRGLPHGPQPAIDAARARLRDEYGVSLPPVRVQTDAPDLPPGGYRIEVREARIAEGLLPPEGCFVTPPLPDTVQAQHPRTSAPGGWAESGAGLDPPAFLTAHLVATWQRSRSAILGVQAVADAVGRLEAEQPALVRAVVPRIVTVPRLADLLQRLLAEDVPVRDLGAVLEALATQPVGADSDDLLTNLRRHLAPLISQRIAPTGRLEAIYPDPAIEAGLRSGAPLSPGDVEGLLDDLHAVLLAHPNAVLVTSADVRPALHSQIAGHHPGLMVVAIEELVPQLKTVSVGLVG